MKIVVIGGSGLIGKKVVKDLRQHAHEVAAASNEADVAQSLRRMKSEAALLIALLGSYGVYAGALRLSNVTAPGPR